jgi:predicted nuclease of predicted toxin-antitoxin system
MKVLLDENLPHRLRSELHGHDVYTVAYMKWAGIGNGELLRVAAAERFDAVITNDRGLEYQQNIGTLPVAVIVLLAKANTIEAIRPLCPELLATLDQLRPREFVKLSAP